MKILVTGGAGYIGSHTCVELLQTGYEVVVVDNFDNSKPEAIHRIEELANQSISFYEADVRDEETLRGIFAKEHIDAVIHFAGLKAVGESVRVPLKYYNNNLISTLVLLDVMNEFGVKNFVFSSSATVYGNPSKIADYRGFSFVYYQPIRHHKTNAGTNFKRCCKSRYRI